MLLISRFMGQWKITSISALCSIDKLSFPYFSIFSFLFSLQYILLFLKSLRICILLRTPFTSVICPSMASWSRQFLLCYVGYYLEVSSSLLYAQELFSVNIIISILLQHHISKLSKYFRSNFYCRGPTQISEPYKAMLQTQNLSNFFLSSMCGMLVESDFFVNCFFGHGKSHLHLHYWQSSTTRRRWARNHEYINNK